MGHCACVPHWRSCLKPKGPVRNHSPWATVLGALLHSAQHTRALPRGLCQPHLMCFLPSWSRSSPARGGRSLWEGGGKDKGAILAPWLLAGAGLGASERQEQVEEGSFSLSSLQWGWRWGCCFHQGKNGPQIVFLQFQESGLQNQISH